MITGLPRPFLWTEIKTMDEFLNGDISTMALYDILRHLKGTLFVPNLNEVLVFNELFYQLTRFFYEKPAEKDYLRYVSDIKANLGWAFSADLVMSMMYRYCVMRKVRLSADEKSFMRVVKERHGRGFFWGQFSNILCTVDRWVDYVPYPFKPCPVQSGELERYYWDWMGITHNFNLDIVKAVLLLWGKDEDKKNVAGMISRQLDYVIYLNHGNTGPYSDVCQYLVDLTGADSPLLHQAKSADTETAEQKEQMSIILQEQAGLKEKITELEAENKRLNTLLSEKNNDGENRKFTLLQIVDYCKGCVEWRNAEQIVAMLNKMLRCVGTEEDHHMVDSIEAEFVNRKYGNTFENANVTMQQPTINGPINEIHGNDNVSLGGK